MIKRLNFDENGNLILIEFYETPFLGNQQIKEVIFMLRQTMDDMNKNYPFIKSENPIEVEDIE